MPARHLNSDQSKMRNLSQVSDESAQNKTVNSTLKNENLEDDQVQMIRPEPLKILLDWSSPERLFKKRDKEYFTTIGMIVLLLVIILLFLQEWSLIAVIIALTFYAYITATIEPQKTNHKITNQGIVTGGAKYAWEVLGRYWFSEKWNQKMLNVETAFHFPHRLILLLEEIKQEEVEKVFSQYLLSEEPEETWTDKASDWLSKRIPLEKN